MPTEIIGEVTVTREAEREWISAECELAIKHLKKVCGEPPMEMELQVQWQEHELGSYPTIGLAAVWLRLPQPISFSIISQLRRSENRKNATTTASTKAGTSITTVTTTIGITMASAFAPATTIRTGVTRTFVM